MEPIFTNDAVVLGLLICVLAAIMWTSSSENKMLQKFYTYVPALLLMYFIPALMYYPLGLIAPYWYDASISELLAKYGLGSIEGMNYTEITGFLKNSSVPLEEILPYQKETHLYFVASRYLLPASLILLCLGIDFKGIMNLGPKAIIMFLAATTGIVVGGPIALLIVINVFPGLIDMSPTDLWKGLSTVAGSWIGGGANQTAMKEIFEVKDSVFASMLVVDVVVANIWMGFLLYGANISDKLDTWLKADNSSIKELTRKMELYEESVRKVASTKNLMILLAIAFGVTSMAHLGSDIIVPFFESFEKQLTAMKLNSLMSRFFWIIVIATTVGLVLSFTRAREMEGYGASKWGSVFIYILVATIGMHMNLRDVVQNLDLFAIGIIWMLVHIMILLLVAKIIKAPFFFVAVGSQANVGGAASAPIVASAFSSSLAPVGALMAVLGYALGTYGALLCAYMMSWVSS